MQVCITYDNAEKGQGFYIDLVKREYTEEEQKKYGCSCEAECVGFSENEDEALEIAHSIAKQYNCEVSK